MPPYLFIITQQNRLFEIMIFELLLKTVSITFHLQFIINKGIKQVL